MTRSRTTLPITCAAVIVVAVVSIALAVYFKDNSSIASGEGEEEASWSGMDESVVEAYASEHGREASGPLLPVEEGDILLFLFCLGGFAAGLLFGYNWRRVVSEKKSGGLEETGMEQAT